MVESQCPSSPACLISTMSGRHPASEEVTDIPEDSPQVKVNLQPTQAFTQICLSLHLHIGVGDGKNDG